MKLSYIGAGLGAAVLYRLISDGHEICDIVCAEEDLPVFSKIANEEKLSNTQITTSKVTRDTLEKMIDKGVSTLIVNGYSDLVPIDDLPLKGINIHPSPLPIGRGRNPISWTILLGHEQSGLTTHKLTPEFDAGDILLQTFYDVSSDETEQSLFKKFQDAAPRHVSRTVRDLKHLWTNGAVVQEGGSYWRPITGKDMLIDWTCSVERIERTVRAFNLFGAKAFLNEQRYRINRVSIVRETPTIPAGTFLPNAEGAHPVLAAADGYIRLEEFSIY